MKVLVVGSGGREHAIITSVSKSKRVDKIYCAPGNAGIASLAECVSIGAMEFDKLVAFAKEKEIDANRVAALVKGIRAADGVEVFSQESGKQIEYSVPLIQKLLLKSPLIKAEIVRFSLKTSNFIKREKNV